MSITFARGAAALFAIGLASAASAQSNDDWRFRAAIYGYFPDISGTTTFPPHGDSKSSTAEISSILDSLKFAFMGTFEANKGRWGVLADVIYMDVGNTKQGVRDFQIGHVGIPADVNATVGYDLKGWIATMAGTYRMVGDPDFTADAVFGARWLDMSPKVNWTLTGNVGQFALADRAGTREVDESNVDAIIGVKGRKSFGADNRWFVPYYLDIGTGQSKFTWQAIAGLGYAFGWGDVVGAWRYTDYDMKSGDAIQDLSFNGPAIAVVFHW